MAYTYTPTRIETLILAESAEDAVDMYEVALMIDGVQLETLPSRNPLEENAAIEAYRDNAMGMQRARLRVDPEGRAAAARRTLASGGAVLRLCIDSSEYITATSSISLFYKGLSTIRKAY